MLAQRVAVSLVGVPLILGLIALGGVGYSLAVGAVLVLAAQELFVATDPQRSSPDGGGLIPRRPSVLLGGAAVALLVAGAHHSRDWWTGALALSVALLFLPSILRGEALSGFQEWLWLAGGVFYVGFLGSHLVLLRQLEDGRDWMVLAVFATFATDTAAYFTGRRMGRTHLVPRISPGKTLEGSLGGLLGGALAVLLINWATGLRVGPADVLPLALLLPLAAELGDLAESLIKRGAGLKDAGRLVPGHGGLLDRLDSVLFTVPLVYYFVIWVMP